MHASSCALLDELYCKIAQIQYYGAVVGCCHKQEPKRPETWQRYSIHCGLRSSHPSTMTSLLTGWTHRIGFVWPIDQQK